MIKKHFSFKETFAFAWAKTKQHAWFLVLTFIIAEIIMGAVRFVPFINGIVALFVWLSLASISLIISRDQSFSFKDLFTPVLSPNRTLKFIALAIIYAIPIGLLLIAYVSRITGALYNSPALFATGTFFMFLLAIPVLYISVRLKFFPYILIENEHASIKELLKMSLRLTRNHFLPLFAFIVVLAAFNVIGAMFFLIGLLVTIPISMFAMAHVYLKLKEHSM